MKGKLEILDIDLEVQPISFVVFEGKASTFVIHEGKPSTFIEYEGNARNIRLRSGSTASNFVVFKGKASTFVYGQNLKD